MGEIVSDGFVRLNILLAQKDSIKLACYRLTEMMSGLR